jgi:hypothetical protein
MYKVIEKPEELCEDFVHFNWLVVEMNKDGSFGDIVHASRTELEAYEYLDELEIWEAFLEDDLGEYEY